MIGHFVDVCEVPADMEVHPGEPVRLSAFVEFVERQTVTAREVKEAFLLGNALKRDWCDYEAFKDTLQQEKKRIEALTEASLNDLITDKHRLLIYDTATHWMLVEVPLANCQVWPHMGGRKYLTGNVEEAAKLFLRHGKDDDRLHAMSKMAKADLFTELPIIVFRRNHTPDKFRIDDGNNRAVAMWLAGMRVVSAFVGTVRADLNYRW